MQKRTADGSPQKTSTPSRHPSSGQTDATSPAGGPDQKDNNKLDGSIGANWYAAKIFTSTTIQVMALGLLSQNGFSTPVSFIENVMPELLNGKTLAESMIGDSTIGDTIIIGDPTFHFTI